MLVLIPVKKEADLLLQTDDCLREVYRNHLLKSYKTSILSPFERFQLFTLHHEIYQSYDPIHIDKNLSHLSEENQNLMKDLILHSKYFYLIDQNFLDGIFFQKKGNIPLFIEYLNRVKSRIDVEQKMKDGFLSAFHLKVVEYYQQQCAQELLSSYSIFSSLDVSTPVGYSVKLADLIRMNFEICHSMPIEQLYLETFPKEKQPNFSKAHLSSCIWNYPSNPYESLLMGGNMQKPIQEFLQDVSSGKVKSHHLYEDLRKIS